MTLKSAYEVWEFFKEYEGDERIKGMKVMNLLREFELQRMKESETVKEYSDRLLVIANKVRLLGSQLSDSRIVQKIIVTVPERFEATISPLENTKDMSRMSLTELTQALQSQKQIRLMRSEESVEGALVAKNQSTQAKKGNSNFDSHNTLKGTKPNFPHCKHCGRKGHPPFKCWKRQDQPSEFPPCNHCGKKGYPPFKCWKRSDQKCEKCNKKGHHQKICKSDTQHMNAAQTTNQEQDDQLAVETTDLPTSQKQNLSKLL
ncbi:uncharacterized protein LOC127259530 [Andrographis paniculata]|uniref:uncharacterized protein LOC127259530 n=1 Tax=Andrographis paniculata TaxID=175694 RepID=UPI0021E80B51|nr:uncharacterized protein LOC127259530 [Andrographis paniculata]